MKVFGYVRVSSEVQAQSGLGMDAQRETILAECSRRGWTVVGWAVETVSSRARRPGLEDAIAQIEDGVAEGLVVAKLDRLARSVGDFASIMGRADKNDWTLICIEPHVDMSTPYGRAMANMAATFAQLERDLISQRTREALAAKMAAGWKPGEAEGHRISDEARRRIRSLRLQGDSSFKVAKKLTLEGFLPPGETWLPRSIRKTPEWVEATARLRAKRAA